MYRLKRKAEPVRPDAMQDEARRAAAYATTLLADSSQGLTFDPVPHKYYLGNREMRSVSSIVEEFAPFDSLAKAKSCSKNKRHELFGKDPEEILAIWNERKNAASKAGTLTHSFGEACFLTVTGRESELDDVYRTRMNDEGLEASTPKEEAVARWWDETDLVRFVPITKEAMVVSPAYGYAGTFDVLMYDLKEHSFALRDYKTNGDLFKWFGDMLLPPLSPIKANDHGKYTLQQNLYRIQLENMGIHVGSMTLVWLKEDGSYEEVNIKEYDKLIRFAMDHRIKTA